MVGEPKPDAVLKRTKTKPEPDKQTQAITKFLVNKQEQKKEPNQKMKEQNLTNKKREPEEENTKEPKKESEAKGTNKEGTKPGTNHSPKIGTKAKPKKLGTKTKLLKLEDGISPLKLFLETKAKARQAREGTSTHSKENTFSTPDAANLLLMKMEDDASMKFDGGKKVTQLNKGKNLI